MAVAATNLTSVASATDATSYATASITPTANYLVLAAVESGETGATTEPSLSGCGLTWVLVKSVTNGVNRRLSVFRAMGSAPSAGAVTADFAGVTQSGCSIVVDQVSGVNTAGAHGVAAVRQPTSNTAASATSLTVTLGTQATADGVWACFRDNQNATITAGSGFTRLADVGHATPNARLETQWRATNDTSVDASGTSGDWLGIALDLVAAPVRQWPGLSFRVAFDTDPLDDSPSYTDLSSRLSSASLSLGATSGQGDDMPPGSADYVLENDDRELDPLNTAGTYYGKLTPRRRLYLEATHPNVPGSVALSTTFAQDWPTDWHEPAVGESQIHGDDGFSLLTVPAPPSVWAIEIAADDPWAWYRLGDTGLVVVDSSGNGHHGVYQAPPSTSESLVYGDSNGGASFTDDLDSFAVLPASVAVDAFDFTMEARVRMTGTFPIGESRFIISQDPQDAALVAFGLLVIRSSSDVRERSYPAFRFGGYATVVDAPLLGTDSYTLTGTANATTITLYVDGTEIDTAPAASSLVTINPRLGGEDLFGGIPADVDEVVVFKSELSAARVLAHHNAAVAPWDGDTVGERLARYLDLAGWPAALRDLDDGRTLGPAALGGEPILDLIQIAARTEQGWFWQQPDGTMTLRDGYAGIEDERSTISQATFTDDPAAPSGSYRFEDLVLEPANIRQVRNVITVNWVGGEVTEQDDASVGAYGAAPHSIDTVCESEGQARALAQWQLLHYKDPATRVTGVVLNPAADQTLWPAVLTLRMGDRVTIRRHPLSQASAFSFDAIIAGRDDTIAEGVDVFTTTFHLAPVEPYDDWWILGTSELGTETRLAY